MVGHGFGSASSEPHNIEVTVQNRLCHNVSVQSDDALTCILPAVYGDNLLVRVRAGR